MDRFRYLLDNAKFEFKKYQYDGVEWCVNNELRLDPPNNIRGGFIADEMGLGKTITMIGTMFVNLVPRTLIVVPPVLIHQWFNEKLSHCIEARFGCDWYGARNPSGIGYAHHDDQVGTCVFCRYNGEHRHG